jgi:dTDP-4-dehydrorhamnose reductase
LRVLTTGTNGQLGQEPIDHTTGRSHEVVAFSRGELDIIDPTVVEREETSVSINEPRNL